jgi:hypothetical protein
MPLVEVIVAAVVDLIIPEAISAAAIDGTTAIANITTGALEAIGIPAEIASGLATVGGDAALGGGVGAGLGAGQAAITGEDIGKGALSGAAGGAAGLGVGNLASKEIASQAANIFNSSTSKLIGETIGQGVGGFTGGVASGANLKDSATMAALGAALGGYSALESKGAGFASSLSTEAGAEKSLVDQTNLLAKDYNAKIESAKSNFEKIGLSSKQYNDLIQPYSEASTYTQQLYNSNTNTQWAYKDLIKMYDDAKAISDGIKTQMDQFKSTYDTASKEYQADLSASKEFKTKYDTAKSQLDAETKKLKDALGAETKYQKDFADAQQKLVDAKAAETAYEREIAPSISDKTTSAGGEFKPAGEGITADKQLGKEVTASAEKVKPEEPLGGTKTSKTGSNISKALDIVQLLPVSGGATGSFGGGGGTPLPQGGLTSTATPGPGSSALAQVLNQGGAGAPVFGTQEGKGKKSKWNIASLRYMGNQDKGA